MTMCNRLQIWRGGGTWLATIREVALRANVSVATVSRVINNKGYVDAKTREEVLKVIRELNYVPKSVAQVLAGKKMKAIALMVPDISNPFFAELAKAVEDTAYQKGFTVFLCNSDDQARKKKLYIDVLKSKSIDGMILATHQLDKEVFDQCQEIPLILMDRAYIHEHIHENCTVITTQNRQGVKLAIEHLLSIGCQKIAHIYGPPKLITAKERLLAYLDAVKSFPWASDTLLAPGYFQIAGGRQAMRTLMERHPDLDGVFVGNDTMAIGALKELHQMGISVPEQVAICGFDGIPIAQMIEPELTTIEQPIYELGKQAAQMLIERIEGTGVVKKQIQLTVQLKIRDSTQRRSK